jgi:exosome complex component RRP4
MEERRNWVIPGVTIGKRDRRIKLGDFIVEDYRGLVSTIMGVIHKGKGSIDIIPYKDVYKPKRGDYVIGVVVGYAPNGWIIDIGSYTKAFLPASEVIVNRRFDPRKDELSRYFSVGDVVGVLISDVRRLGYFNATLKSPNEKDRRLGKLKDYYMMKVVTSKLPRIIGKKGSMIKIIKNKLDGDLILGQNGVIIYKGPYKNFVLLQKIINFIASKTFASGLTDAVVSLLEKELEKGVYDKESK